MRYTCPISLWVLLEFPILGYSFLCCIDGRKKIHLWDMILSPKRDNSNYMLVKKTSFITTKSIKTKESKKIEEWLEGQIQKQKGYLTHLVPCLVIRLFSNLFCYLYIYFLMTAKDLCSQPQIIVTYWTTPTFIQLRSQLYVHVTSKHIHSATSSLYDMSISSKESPHIPDSPSISKHASMRH